MLEIVVEGLQNKVPDFLVLFKSLLHDPESIEVRLVTVRALGTLSGYIDVEDKADIVSLLFALPKVSHAPSSESLPNSGPSNHSSCWRSFDYGQ